MTANAILLNHAYAAVKWGPLQGLSGLHTLRISKGREGEARTRDVPHGLQSHGRLTLTACDRRRSGMQIRRTVIERITEAV